MRHTPDCLYVATDGELLKIGISANPAERVYNLGKLRLIKFWRRPYARRLESHIKDIFYAYRARPRQREWFKISESEFLFEVCRVVRIEDDDYAIRNGMKPSDRGSKAVPPMNLPFVRLKRKVK